MKSLGDADTGSLVIKHANLHLHSSYSDGVLKPKTIIEKELKPQLIGEDPFKVEKIWNLFLVQAFLLSLLVCHNFFLF